VNDSFIIMCRDSLTPNMRKEVEEIVAANSKEGDSTSTDDLLKQLIEVTEKQNNLLSESNTESKNTNLILIYLSVIAFIIVLYNLITDGPGMERILTAVIIILIVVVSIIFSIIGNKEKKKSVVKVPNFPD